MITMIFCLFLQDQKICQPTMRKYSKLAHHSNRPSFKFQRARKFNIFFVSLVRGVKINRALYVPDISSYECLTVCLKISCWSHLFSLHLTCNWLMMSQDSENAFPQKVLGLKVLKFRSWSLKAIKLANWKDKLKKKKNKSFFFRTLIHNYWELF